LYGGLRLLLQLYVVKARNALFDPEVDHKAPQAKEERENLEDPPE